MDAFQSGAEPSPTTLDVSIALSALIIYCRFPGASSGGGRTIL